MHLTIEKTESGSYTVTDHNDTVSYGYAETGVMSSVLFFMAQDLPLPKEPEIPACLHCGSKNAPRVIEGGGRGIDGDTLTVRHIKLICDATKGGCGFSSGAFHSMSEIGKALALWAGVKQ